ncbi:glycosyltransferase family 4 protein [Luteimicrobium sp. DT211]|uniref:glycosyltransferase family 4 protein n=1 Tax=Luteimicrobium sp. DT211 TaxID=3393412 RepID=UPI003CE82B5E
MTARRRLRVLLSVDRLGGLGGVETMSVMIAEALARQGHQIDIVYVQRVGAVPAFAHSASRVRALDVRLRRPFAALREILPVLVTGIRRRPDVIYVHRFEELAFALPLHFLTGARIICHLHYFSPRSRVALKSRGVAHFIAVSEATAKQWMTQGVDPTKVTVVPNGVDVDAFPLTGTDDRHGARLALRLPQDAFVALFCGRVSPEKGVHDLVHAWAELGLPPDQARLLVVGVSSEGDANALAYQGRLIALAATGVEWLAARLDVLTPMRAADVLVLPSRVESFGLVLAEAMSTGLPIIATRVGGIPETVGASGTLVADGDAAALVDALRRAAAGGQTQDARRRALRQHVVDRLSLDATAQRIEQLLIDSARPRRRWATHRRSADRRRQEIARRS